MTFLQLLEEFWPLLIDDERNKGAKNLFSEVRGEAMVNSCCLLLVKSLGLVKMDHFTRRIHDINFGQVDHLLGVYIAVRPIAWRLDEGHICYYGGEESEEGNWRVFK